MGGRRKQGGTDPETRKSLAFYFGLILLAGQFLARVALGIPFDFLFLSVTAALVLGVLFGPSFVIEFLKAVRGNSDAGDGKRNDQEADDGG